MNKYETRLEEFGHSIGIHTMTTAIFRALTPSGRYLSKIERRLHNFYAPLLQDSKLIFDVGANRGLYSRIFSAFGRVIALEPNPDCVRHIRIFCPGVEVIEAAVGERDGMVSMNISDSSDTMSTMSEGWMKTIRQPCWNRKLSVPLVRLDTLIEHLGMPDYLKVDVEGAEEQVLAGLSQCPNLISFEYNAYYLESSLRCASNPLFAHRRFNFLRDERFNFAESGQRFSLLEWVSQQEAVAYLRRLQGGIEHGDIFVS